MEEFTITEKGELLIRWNIGSNYRKLSFNELIISMLKEFKEIGSKYNSFVKEDGKLIGNEKIEIIRSLRETIQIVLVIKDQLQSKYKFKVEANEQVKYLKIDEYSFQMNYKLYQKDIQNLDSFKQWYDNKYTVEMDSFKLELKKDLEDKVLTEQEAIELNKKLDQIFISNALFYNKMIYNGIMN